MDFQVDTLGPCRKRVAVTVPPERVREEYDRQFEEINQKLVMPGFRKGHAPRRVLEKRFATSLGQDVKEKLVQKALEELVEGKRVDPLQPPEIDLESLTLEPEAPFTFAFELVTKPEFETPRYEGLEVKVPPVAVSEEDVQAGIDRLRRTGAKLQTAEGAAVQDRDVLVVDWRALTGDSVEAHDENVYYPFGRGVLAGFAVGALDEQLRGKGPGAVGKASVQVADDDPREELRGKKLDLEVTLKEVKRYVLPEVDEAFLKRHDYDDLDELKEDVRKSVLRQRLRERELLAEDRLLEGMLKGIEMALPEDFVAREMERWARSRRMSLEMEGVDEAEIAKQIDEAREHAKSHIEADLKRFFVLERIAEKESLETTEAELVRTIEEIASRYGRPIEEVLASFRDGGRIGELAAEIRHRKVRELVRTKATMVEEAPPPAEDPAPAAPPTPKKSKRG
jgi:trigger factor